MPRNILLGLIGAALIVVLFVVLQLTCQADGTTAPGSGTPTPDAGTPTPVVDGPTRTPTPDPTPTPAAQSPSEASNLVWSYLGQCYSFGPVDLVAHLVRGDWFVQASTGSLTSYGLWKIAVSSGALEPQDPLARQLQSDVEAQCALGVLASLATATPPSPLPTATPTVPAVPAVQTMNDARNLVWSYLGQCSSFDPSQLQVFLVQGDWFVQALPTSPQQYGLWKVDALTGGLTPPPTMSWPGSGSPS